MKTVLAVLTAALLSSSIATRAQAPATAQAVAAQPGTVRPHEVEDFIRKQKFKDIKISPTGEYYAASVPSGRKTSLVILRRSDNKLMASLVIPGDRTHVEGFWWVNDERVLITPSEKFGSLEAPQLNGELFAVNADGGKGEMLVGYRVQGEGPGSRIQPKKVEQVFATLVDDLPNDDKNVIISVSPFTADPYTRLERLNVYTGQRLPITQAPVRNASFVTDNAGEARFALGKTVEWDYKLYYRSGKGGEWTLMHDSGKDGLVHEALGFSADDRTAYLRVDKAQGPDAIVALDIASGERRDIARDDDTSPALIIRSGGTALESDSLGMDGQGHPVGVSYMDGLPRTQFFDPQSPMARLYAKLERAFAGERVTVTSTTTDGRLALVLTTSDRNPGDFFVFDSTTNQAGHLLSRRDWIDPARTATARPVRFKARDGLDLHGYLTTPVGGEAKQAPLVVLVHGGPFGVRDDWRFDNDDQILAAHGYAVLRVNFRGSGGYGASFIEAGQRQWGGTMQDDITDATQWAIREGVADPARICLYGASYGAYASLMGVAKEPALYRCAAGYVGVYDLPTMHTLGDIQSRASGQNYLNDWVGPRDGLAALSPNRIADRIKVPVFLAAGGEDERTPMKHTELMEKALRNAGVPVEALYYPTEGHGFHKLENEREYYARLLSFFHRHLGGRAPVAAAVTPK